MAFYRAKVRCFVDKALREPGDVFEYNGTCTAHLELIKDETSAELKADIIDHAIIQPERKAGRPRK